MRALPDPAVVIRHSFRAVFEEVHAFFGPFTDQALEQSSFLIDRLVERTSPEAQKHAETPP